MKMTCTFEIIGKIEEKRFDDSKYGRPYWYLEVLTDDGRQGIYVHDEHLQVQIPDLPVGTVVRASGTITAKPGEQHKPIFLSPNTMEVLSLRG